MIVRLLRQKRLIKRVLRLVTVATLLGAHAAAAENFPNRPMRIIVPYAPGGVGDVVSRVMGEKLSQILGQPVVIESRPGGNSNAATFYVMHAPADGYTLLMASPSLAANPSLYPGLWDTSKDFTTLSIVATAPNVVTVPVDLKANTLQEFIDLAKRSPGKLNYGNPAIGSSMHLNTEVFKLEAGVDLVSIPYPGQPPSIIALIRGDLSVVFLSAGLALPQIASNELKALAVVGLHRLPALPNVPTMAEAGYPNANIVPHYGIVVSAKTPSDIAKKINAAMADALRSPDVQVRLRAVGLDPEPPRGLTESQAIMQSDVIKYREVVEKAGLKSE